MLRLGKTDADSCRLNGWGPGTRLLGRSASGNVTIRITAVGEEAILAIAEVRNNTPDINSVETCWTLRHRFWELAPSTPVSPEQPTSSETATPSQNR